MKITEPGIYRDMSSADYFADCCPDPSFTQSLAKILIAQTPLHARQEHPVLAQKIDDPDDEEAEKYDKAKAIGNAAHAYMLSRGKSISVLDFPNLKTKAAQEAKKAAIEAGAEPILRKHNGKATMMVIAAHSQLQSIDGCERAFQPKQGSGEVVIACQENGIWLRQMLDWPTNDLREIWDYKTTGMSASPYTAGKQADDAGWPIQAAMSERILNTIDPDGAGRRHYRFVYQENYAPFALTVSEIDEAALTIGRKKLDYAIERWRECMTTGKWPGYPLKIIRPQLPEWSVNRWLEREIIEYDERQESKPTSAPIYDLAGG